MAIRFDAADFLSQVTDRFTISVSGRGLFLLRSLVSLAHHRGVWVGADEDGVWDEVSAAVAECVYSLRKCAPMYSSYKATEGQVISNSEYGPVHLSWARGENYLWEPLGLPQFVRLPAGTWLILAQIQFNTEPSGDVAVGMRVLLNGNGSDGALEAHGSSYSPLQMSTVLALASETDVQLGVRVITPGQVLSVSNSVNFSRIDFVRIGNE